MLQLAFVALFFAVVLVAEHLGLWHNPAVFLILYLGGVLVGAMGWFLPERLAIPTGMAEVCGVGLGLILLLFNGFYWQTFAAFVLALFALIVPPIWHLAWQMGEDPIHRYRRWRRSRQNNVDG